jgi:hypothetical protein
MASRPLFTAIQRPISIIFTLSSEINPHNLHFDSALQLLVSGYLPSPGPATIASITITLALLFDQRQKTP